MKKLPLSGLQTARRAGGELVNTPNKRPNMKNYTPGEKAPKQSKKLPSSGLQTATRIDGKLVNAPSKRPNMKSKVGTARK